MKETVFFQYNGKNVNIFQKSPLENRLKVFGPFEYFYDFLYHYYKIGL